MNFEIILNLRTDNVGIVADVLRQLHLPTPEPKPEPEPELGEYTVDVPTQEAIDVPTQTVGINTYRSHRHVFALGTKCYDDARIAASRHTMNDNWLGSIELLIDLNGRAIVQASEVPATYRVPDARYFAIERADGTPTGLRATKGYRSTFDLVDAHPNAVAYFGAAIGSDEIVRPFRI